MWIFTLALISSKTYWYSLVISLVGPLFSCIHSSVGHAIHHLAPIIKDCCAKLCNLGDNWNDKLVQLPLPFISASFGNRCLTAWLFSEWHAHVVDRGSAGQQVISPELSSTHSHHKLCHHPHFVYGVCLKLPHSSKALTARLLEHYPGFVLWTACSITPRVVGSSLGCTMKKSGMMVLLSR